MDLLSSNVDTFASLNGKIFTWYLGHRDSRYEEMVKELEVEKAAGTLHPAVEAIFDDEVRSAKPIPEEDEGNWDLHKPSFIPDSNEYNNSILPEYQSDVDMMDEFTTLMSEEDKDRIFVAAEMKNTVDGPNLVESFLDGLVHLLAKFKQPVRFQK